MTTIRPGASIPSPNVDTSRDYIDGRLTKNLRQVGAITRADADLFERVDGVIANRPVDGRVQVDELLRMETPAHHAALFPAERSRLPQLWRFMEWQPAAAAAPSPVMPGLAVSEQLSLPGAIDFGRPYLIADLPARLQTPARRNELVADADTNPDTISIADIDAALATPDVFTQDDLNALSTIRKHIEAAFRTAAQPGRAVLEVPALGRQEVALGGTGSVSVRIAFETTLELRRERSVQHQKPAFSSDMVLGRSAELEVEVPPGHQAIFLRKGGNQEVLVEAGLNRQPLVGGEYRLELWTNGQRVESHDVNVPAIGDRKVSLGRYVGWNIVDSNQNPLTPVPLEGGLDRNDFQSDRQFVRFGFGVPAPATPVSAQLVNDVSPPAIGVNPGSYEFEMGTYGLCRLHVLDGNIAVAEVEGTRYSMVPDRRGPGWIGVHFSGHERHHVTLNGDHFYVHENNKKRGSFSERITAERRVG